MKIEDILKNFIWHCGLRFLFCCCRHASDCWKCELLQNCVATKLTTFSTGCMLLSQQNVMTRSAQPFHVAVFSLVLMFKF